MDSPKSPRHRWLDWLLAATILLAGGIGFLLVTGDPVYWLRENNPLSRFNEYDDLIAQAAHKNQVPPELVKAIIWQESRFGPDKVGLDGEYGLMQVTEIASKDWVSAEKISNFEPRDLFDPKTNIEAGTWYLGRALRRYRDQDDPHPFALAEYNAGRTRVNRWMNSGTNSAVAADELRQLIDFPSTRSYIENIMARMEFYKRRGEFAP